VVGGTAIGVGEDSGVALGDSTGGSLGGGWPVGVGESVGSTVSTAIGSSPAAGTAASVGARVRTPSRLVTSTRPTREVADQRTVTS
jgi:hypothetical protein